ncbi:MAG: hypothetical protein KKD86_17990 [Bacteroidetes bacterium]|nr:hypothetical protein [Bacteroidota bacterium]
MPEKTKITTLYGKLAEVRNREIYKKALTGMAHTIIILLVINVLLSLAELFGASSISYRTVFYLILLSSVVILTVTLIVIPLLKTITTPNKQENHSAAIKIGKFYPQIKDELLNIIQLIENSDGKSSLINAAFEQLINKTGGLDFKKSVDFKRPKKKLQQASLAIILSVIIFAVFPQLRFSSYRIFNYDQEFVFPQKFFFEVTPGNSDITNGDNIDLKAITVGDSPEHVMLHTKSADETEFKEKEIQSDSTGEFTSNQKKVKNDLFYFFSAEGITSDTFLISVTNRPIIKSLTIDVFPPKYSKLLPSSQRDNGNILALPGSKIAINLSSNKQLQKAEIIYSDEKSMQLTTEGSKAKTQFVVSKAEEYKFYLVDTTGVINNNPITYSIDLIEDRFPVIEVVSPNKDLKLNESNSIPFLLKISDDFGFDRLALHHKLSFSQFEEPQANYSAMEIPFGKNLKETDIYFTWDLTSMFLAARDEITYYFEIFDNDNINGPKSTVTRKFKASVPTMDELFANADEVQEETKDDLTEILDEAEKLKENLEKISNELKKDDKEISWDEREKIEDAVKKLQNLEEKVNEAAEKLSQLKNELQENNLLSEETLKKYLELQNLLQEINSDDLKKALDKMQEMLKNMKRDANQSALDQLKFNEEQFKNSLERTVNLLKRIQIEQKVDEIIKRTENLMNKMEEISKETSSSNESPQEKTAKKQDEVSKGIENLEKEMENLNEKMSELKDMPKKLSEELLEEMEKQQMQETSEEISKELKSGSKKSAKQKQEKLSSQLSSMKKKMENMQSAMQQQSQMEVYFEMMKAVNNLLTLSKEQEKLKEQTKSMSPTSRQFSENTKSQNEILSGLDKITQQMIDLSQKTFAVTPEMGKAIGTARMRIGKSIKAMLNRNGAETVVHQSEAMKSLNEAASLMKGMMNQMMSGGEGGGMMSLMQQMQQMSQQQMGLNQLTQKLNSGQLSLEERAQLQKMAQQQDMIRKSLDQLNKESREAGQSKKLSSNLEKIVQEMKEVVKNMQTEKVTDELIQAQERILTKMLDVQRSINERDFENNRESKTGNIFARESPSELDLNTEEGQNKLMDELQRAIQEGYSRDYEELIRKYFEALQKLNQEQKVIPNK